MNTVETAPQATPSVPAAPALVTTAPAAGLNSVKVVLQPAYTFNHERFLEISDGDGGVTFRNCLQ